MPLRAETAPIKVAKVSESILFEVAGADSADGTRKMWSRKDVKSGKMRTTVGYEG